MLNMSNHGNLPDTEGNIADVDFGIDSDINFGIEGGMHGDGIIDEEPAAEPEPEFDPEAAISTSRFSRRKLLCSSLIIGVMVIVAVSLGVSLSNKNKGVETINSVKSNNNEDTSSTLNEDVSTLSTTDEIFDIEKETDESEDKRDKTVTINVEDIGNFIDVSKGFMVDLQGFS